MTPKEEFIEIYTKYITRNGAEELLEWLKRTDFLLLLQVRNIIVLARADL